MKIMEWNVQEWDGHENGSDQMPNQYKLIKLIKKKYKKVKRVSLD